MVVEEAEGLKTKLSEVAAPPELTQRIKDLEAQASAKDETYAKLRAENAAKDEA